VERTDRGERPGGQDDDRGTAQVGEEARIRELPDEDVQVGPEMTDLPKAGSTEPPD
jgi:hypothetical protein